MGFTLKDELVSDEPTTDATAASGVGITSAVTIADVPIEAAGSDVELDVLPTARFILESPAAVKSMLKENSLSAKKPEILLSARFLPAVDQLKMTSVDKMLEVQYTMRNLRIDDVEAILIELEKDPLILEKLNIVIDNNQILESEIESNIAFYITILDKLRKTKLALDIKNNINAIKGSTDSVRESVDSWLYTPTGEYTLITEIFSQYLHFPNTSFYAFSNTKIVSQLISDLKNSIKFYSPQLLATFDNIRDTDIDPLTINTSTISDDNSFTFKTSDITEFDHLSTGDFLSFSESLPSDSFDRIKLMVVTLSKELRISAGIARLLATPLGEKYSVDSSPGLIERIIGNTGNSITDPVPTAGTLAAFTRFKDEKNQTILPFESTLLIDRSRNKNYIPGSAALVDIILDSDGPQEGIAALSEYNEVLSDTVGDATEILGTLLNYDPNAYLNAYSDLHFESLLNEIYSEVSNLLATYNEDHFSATVPPKEFPILSLALLKEANNDPVLKSKLFAWCVSIYVYAPNFISGLDTDGDGVPDDEDATPTGDSGTFIITGGTPSRLVSGGTREEWAADVEAYIKDRFIVPASQDTPAELRKPHNETDLTIVEINAESTTTTGYYGAFSDIVDIFYKISNYASVISQQTAVFDEDGVGFKTGAGGTRFKNLSDQTLLLLIFEIFSSIIVEFASPEFKPVHPSELWTYRFKFIPEQDEAVSARINDLLAFGPTPALDQDSSYYDLLGGLDNMQSGLAREENAIRDIIDCIQGIASSASESASETTEWVKLNSSDIFNEDSNVLANLTRKQIALSYEAIDDLFSTSDLTFSPKEQAVSEAQYRILNSLLKEPEFDSAVGSNIKLLSIGLPSGMHEHLESQPFIIGEDTGFSGDVGTNIVTIKIYKRDPEFADIIFEPMTFIFDMSKFTTNSGQEVYTNSSFDTNLTTRILLKGVYGYTDTYNIETLDQFKLNNVYNSLTDKEKTSIFRNHAVSDTLNTYLKLMTGINTSEFTFLSNPQLLASQQIDQYIKDLLSNTSVDTAGRTSTKDAEKSYEMLLNSLILRAGQNKIRIEQPKLFERTFIVPVDPDEYIIDILKTSETANGRLALSNIELANGTVFTPSGRFTTAGTPIEQTKIKPRSKKEGNFEFSEFFVVVALGAD